MNTLNKDILIKICLYLRDSQILSLALTTKHLYVLLFLKDDLWLAKVTKQYSMKYYNSVRKQIFSLKWYYKELKQKRCFWKSFVLDCYRKHEHQCWYCGIYVYHKHHHDDGDLSGCDKCYFAWKDYLSH